MSNRLTRWLQSDDFFPKRGIDDVLNLSTGKDLEAHAHSAADKASDKLDDANKREQQRAEELDTAAANYDLAASQLSNTEKLARSVTYILNRLRR